MKDWTIRRRIVVSFGAILTLIIVIGGVLFTELRSIDGAIRALRTDSLPGLETDMALESAFTTNYLLIEQHGRLEDQATMDKVSLEITANQALIDELMARNEAGVFTDRERELFRKVQDSRVTYLQAQRQIIQANETASAAQSTLMISTQLAPELERLKAALNELSEYDRLTTENAAEEIADSVSYALISIATSFVVALVLAALCGYFLVRAIMTPLNYLLRTTDVVSKGDFTQRITLDRRDEFGTLGDAFNRMIADLNELIDQVRKSAIQVNTSVTQIGATSNEQQATATEIAATTTEIGATSREISATSRELVHTMQEVSVVAEQTAGLAGGGQEGLVRMEETMRKVTEAAASINAKLVVLNEKASNINQVVTTITKVADQTNLLSLNAAIEAEKAGEAGRGFAVVATEIRRLADQTGVATYDIEQTVKEIQSAVAAGVMGMDKFSEEVRRGMQEVQQVGGQLSQIIHQVQTLAPRFVAVNEGMQAQATGAGQISDALSQLTDASQQTVESLRQSNEAIGGLNSVANGLRGAVLRFKLQA
ncbi:methyl-accepting chemotaxis protein [Povalibacter sp.]|uniref:methyl-accepting chemotaxis protein n=1 Tax=Povalibacter sp. TaxID=1962978 RepID=UPI002F42F752